MINSINYNNYNSLFDIGLAIDYRPIFPVPQRNINFINVEGRNGSLTEDLGTYQDIEIPINFNLKDINDIDEKVRFIKNWLIGEIKDNKLSFSDDSDYFYKVKAVRTDFNIRRILQDSGKFTATFVCDPFSYLKDGLDTITITQPTTIYNQGTTESEPLLKIYGAGNVSITINNKTFYLNSMIDYLVVDSEMGGECFRDTQPMNNYMEGEPPIFSVGENTISWTGNITKIEINPRWRFL